MKPTINALFAEPICLYEKINVDYINDKILLPQLKELDLHNLRKKGTFLSNDQHILNNIDYGNFVKQSFCELAKKHFAELGYNTNFRIGTSWLVQTNPDAEGEFHYHSNYWFSGCYYPDQGVEEFIIYFKRPYNFHITPKIAKYNPFNSSEVKLICEPGSLILFPSYLQHKIGINNTKKNRFSLAFNINPFGQTGEGDSKYNFS